MPIPIMFIAQQISAMNVVGLNVATDGSYTPVSASAADLKTAGVFDRLELTLDPRPTEVVGTGMLVNNNQRTMQDFSGTLSAVDANGKTNPVLTLAGSFDYVQITATTTKYGSGTGSVKTVTIVALLGQVTTGWVDGKNVTSVNLMACGILPVFT